MFSVGDSPEVSNYGTPPENFKAAAGHFLEAESYHTLHRHRQISI